MPGEKAKGLGGTTSEILFPKELVLRMEVLFSSRRLLAKEILGAGGGLSPCLSPLPSLSFPSSGIILCKRMAKGTPSLQPALAPRAPG